ncbi:peroxisomal biogenesis factor 11 [Leptodontidium sp. 2 PMI_412]|nr:peroxin 11B [Leptodontidium sp. MPI-SDFR-AT-0119]KAH9216375.1 peroxisomal biogenesis factor 11 [Leptodontidium sp. 2 PMI_412]
MGFFKNFIRFTSDATALEKILRLFQSLCQILAAYAISLEDAATWLQLRTQFALGRRYFRFFRFLECFSKAYDCFHGVDGVRGVLAVCKWSCLGGYMFLESVTILDAMGYWPTALAKTCLLEGNKFWFYSLVCSIIWGLLQLVDVSSERYVDEDESSSETEVKARHQFELKRKRRMDAIKTRLVIDGFDLLTPGFVTGWIRTSISVVGFSSVVSTVLSLREIWDRLKE